MARMGGGQQALHEPDRAPRLTTCITLAPIRKRKKASRKEREGSGSPAPAEEEEEEEVDPETGKPSSQPPHNRPSNFI